MYFSIAGTLRGLFTLFVAHVIKNAAVSLNAASTVAVSGKFVMNWDI